MSSGEGDTKGTEEDQGRDGGRLRSFPKTLAPCQAKRGSLEVNGEGLRPMTDIQR